MIFYRRDEKYNSLIYFSVISFFILNILGCYGQQKKIAFGPFEIKSINRLIDDAGAWSTGRSLFTKDTITDFKIYYKNEQIKVLTEVGTVTEFEEALFIKNAPIPTILAGSEEALFLITVKNDKPESILITKQSSRNICSSYQWLDEENGQPGRIEGIFSDNKLDLSRFLSGGRYLMISQQVVLDIKTLHKYPFSFYNNVEKYYGIGEYKFYGSYKGPDAIAFSPDQKKIVFGGSLRSSDTGKASNYYALGIINFSNNTSYTVPIDENNMRFNSELTLEWMNTFFEWSKNNSKLIPRKLDKLPFWKGNFIDNQFLFGYQLSPVSPYMDTIFINFLKTNFNGIVSDSLGKHPNSILGRETDIFNMKFGENVLSIALDKKLKEILITSHLLYENKDSKLLIRQIGNQFNAELEKGKYQEYFSKFD